MNENQGEPLRGLVGLPVKAHPWHGIPLGPDAPEAVTAYIEIVTTDTVKYELDKATGYLTIDRPQRYSNVCPALYGFLPRTLCGERVAALCVERTGRVGIVGDGDPLDVCVLTERPVTHSDILLHAVPIGGFRMIDGEQADDKIIAVLQNDASYGRMKDIGECPSQVVERLRHYFLTYKEVPGSGAPLCEITDIYGAEEAHSVIRRSAEDYETLYGHLLDVLPPALRG